MTADDAQMRIFDRCSARLKQITDEHFAAKGAATGETAMKELMDKFAKDVSTAYDDYYAAREAAGGEPRTPPRDLT